MPTARDAPVLARMGNRKVREEREMTVTTKTEVKKLAPGKWGWVVWRLVDYDDERTKVEAQRNAAACAKAEREANEP